MKDKTKEVYITRNALTNGIRLIPVNISQNFPDMVSDNSSRYVIHYHANEWHDKKEDAIAKAKKMQALKIKSLEKQIDKIKKLKFE